MWRVPPERGRERRERERRQGRLRLAWEWQGAGVRGRQGGVSGIPDEEGEALNMKPPDHHQPLYP